MTKLLYQAFAKFIISGGVIALLFCFGGNGVAFASTAHSTQRATSPQSLHPNINGVSCDGRTDFFAVYYNDYLGKACFANAGSTWVNIAYANEICSGNNHGTYDITINGQPFVVGELGFYSCFNFGDQDGINVTVRFIDIYPPNQPLPY